MSPTTSDMPDLSDDILADLSDHHEERHLLLTAIRDRAPNGKFQMIPVDANSDPVGETLDLDVLLRESIVKKAQQENGITAFELPDGKSGSAIFVEALDTVVFGVFDDESLRHYCAAIVQLSIELFLSEKSQRNNQDLLETQKRQHKRRIGVLESSYQELLEDN
ncbi:MAG: hypothetical protein V3S89_06905, partial [Desulfobacterales bacterium]